jgi:hypothetical protein
MEPEGSLPHTQVPTNTLYTLLLSPICATCSAQPILLDFISQTILSEYRSLSSIIIIIIIIIIMG